MSDLWNEEDAKVAYFKINDTIYGIPKISELRWIPIILGDRDRSAGGTMRAVIVTIKREWMFQTAPIPSSEANDIIDALEGAYYSNVEFRLDTMEENEWVEVYVDINRADRVQFGEKGEWHHDGVEIEFTVEEK